MIGRGRSRSVANGFPKRAGRRGGLAAYTSELVEGGVSSKPKPVYTSYLKFIKTHAMVEQGVILAHPTNHRAAKSLPAFRLYFSPHLLRENYQNDAGLKSADVISESM